MSSSTCAFRSRERKYHVGTRFCGKMSRIIEDGAMEGQRPFVDIYSCSMTLSLNILLFLSDTAIIMHAPNGCHSDSFTLAYLAAKIRNMELENPFMHEMRNIHCCSTNFSNYDVVFGGEEKLRKVIKEVYKRYNPRIICVLSSCVSAIIGDNIEKVCADAQEDMGTDAYVLHFNTNGFQSHAWVNYADHVWSGLVHRVMKAPQKIESDLVNFFRPMNMTNADTEEMERLMTEMGLRVNIFPDYQSVEVIEHAAEAALNVGLCKAYHQPVFDAMFQKFNTPYADAPYPLGIRFTEKWIREIGEKTNRKDLAEQLIEREKNRIQPELSMLRKKLRGKTVVVSANHAKTTGFIQACNDLELMVVSAVSHSSDNSLREEYRAINEDVGDIDFHVGSPIYEEITQLKKIKPDVFVGHLEMASIASQLGYNAKNTYLYNFQNAHFGFEGIIALGRQILRGLNNPLKEKILKYYKNETGLNWRQIHLEQANAPFSRSIKKCAC